MGYKQRRGHRCHVLAAHPVLIQFSSPLRPHPGISDTASPRRCVKLSNLPEIISRTLQTLGSPKRITGRGSLVNIPQPPTASFPPTAINPLIPPSSPHSTTMSSIYGVRFLILIFFSFPFTIAPLMPAETYPALRSALSTANSGLPSSSRRLLRYHKTRV